MESGYEGLHQSVELLQIGLHVDHQVCDALHDLGYDQIEQDGQNGHTQQVNCNDGQSTPITEVPVKGALKKAHGRIEQIGDGKPCDKGHKHPHHHADLCPHLVETVEGKKEGNAQQHHNQVG